MVAGARRGGRAAKPPIPRTSVPRHWYDWPLRRALRTTIRPPTARTRRRLVEVRVTAPRETFDDFMAPLQEGEAEGVVRDEAGALLPTKENASTAYFNYTIYRPMVVDRLLKLEAADEGAGAHASERAAKRKGAWLRGLGCARLSLAAGAHRKGKLGETLSMAAGNLVVEYRLPKRERAPPTLVLRYFVLTMDATGHIEWPVRFSLGSHW